MHWIILPFQRVADYSGRSRRKEFWLFWLVALIVQTVVSYVDAATSSQSIVAGMGLPTLATTLILIVPATMVGIRRLHDAGRSGWWMLLIGVPYAGWLISEDAGSPDAIPAIMLLLGSIVLVVLLVQPGQIGTNLYGPDPKDGIAERTIEH